MAEIHYTTFTGEQPRYVSNLLPLNAAQTAINCEFESGALNPTKAGLLVTTLASNPTKGLHTTDGINFFSWNVEAQTFISPIIEDNYNRMYFLLPSEGVLRAGLTAEMSPLGPTPATTFRLGVPQPTVAPVLTLVDRYDLPQYPGASFNVEAWYEASGGQYGRQIGLAFNVISPFRSYTFTPPAMPSGTPGDAVLTARFQIKDASGIVLVSVQVRSGSSGRSNGLPGGVEISLENSGTGNVLLTWGVTETRAYTYLLENSWGEAGAAAPPTTISPTYIQDVQVALTASDFTGYRPFSKFRVYRTYGGGLSYIETAVTGAGLVYTDASRLPSSVLGAMQSTDWYPPPIGMQGMCLSPNGWFAAFKGSTLYLSEPYRPHAWPYIQKFPFAIVGVYPTKQALVVTTTGGVYLLSGTNPIGSSQFKIDLPQPGISQRSMIDIDGAVAYASHDGFPLVIGNQATMVASQKLFTRSVWRSRYGALLDDGSLRFAYHDGNLIMSSSSQPTGFALRLDEDIGAFSRLDVRMDCTFRLPVLGALYYTVANQLFQFRAGTVQNFEWWGRNFIFPYPATFGAGFIWADGPVTLTLYANEAQVYEAVIATDYFTLPDMNPALRWSVRLRGASTVREFHIARCLRDLKRD